MHLPLRRLHKKLQTLAISFLVHLAITSKLEMVQSDFVAGRQTGKGDNQSKVHFFMLGNIFLGMFLWKDHLTCQRHGRLGEEMQV